MTRAYLFCTAFILSIGCSEPAPVTTPAPAPAPAAETTEPAPKSDAIAKADALIEEMRRNQAAFDKAERETPKPAAPRLEDFVRPAAPAHVPTPQPAQGAYAQQPSAPPAASGDTRGEQWWKDQARTLQDRLEDETRRMIAARAAFQNSTLKITADEAEREYLALQASVRNAQSALDKFRDDARRAGVPAGWARWP